MFYVVDEGTILDEPDGDLERWIRAALMDRWTAERFVEERGGLILTEAELQRSPGGPALLKVWADEDWSRPARRAATRVACDLLKDLPDAILDYEDTRDLIEPYADSDPICGAAARVASLVKEAIACLNACEELPAELERMLESRRRRGLPIRSEIQGSGETVDADAAV